MKKILLFAVLFCMFFACSKENVEPIEEKIPLNISVGCQTKANDSQFETNDKVGIYVVNYSGDAAGTLAVSGNQVDNMRFTYENSSWSPDEPTYWKDKNTKADLFAYYPYDGSLASVSAYPFSVMSDQSTEANFWGSDFLWGKATKMTPTSSAVPIQTNHLMSRIIVNIKPGSGFTNETWAAANKSVQITSVKTSATINLSTGISTEQGEVGTITPLETGENGNIISYMAMMVPQTVANDSKLIIVTVDGVNYIYRNGYTFSANTKHTFTITVNKSGSSVNVTIGEWEIDNNDNNGNAVEESVSPVREEDKRIHYYSSSQIELDNETDFGVDIISHEFDDGADEGYIYFDGAVTKIGDDAFFAATSANFFGIPNTVTSIGNNAFYDTAIMSFDMPTSLVTIGNSAFRGTGFSSIIIPAKVTTIGEDAFRDCTSLSNVESLATSVPSLGDNAFTGISGNATLTVPKGTKSIYESSAWAEYFSSIVEKE